MYIKHVHIQNIKSISEFEMDFPEPAGWHVIIGDNGSGKTTILQAIAVALLGDENYRGLREENWQTWLKQGQNSGAIDVELLGSLEDFETNRDSVPIIETRRKFDISVNVSQSIHSNKGLYWINKGSQNSKAKGWFSTSFGPYRRFDAGESELNNLRKGNPRLAAHISVFNANYTFPSVIEWLKNLQFQSLENKEDSEIQFIRTILNSEGFLPNGVSLSEISSKGVFFSDKDGNVFDIKDLSDGFRSILSLTLELIQQLVTFFGSELVFKNKIQEKPTFDLPGVVFIDEIDAHLHPSWQVEIGERLTSIFPNIQFIVTTHSPLVCRAATNGSIWRLVVPENGESSSAKLSKEDADRLIFGNILDAYGTEVFGKAAVRSKESNEKLERLGHLNMLAAFGKINPEEEQERKELQLIFTTDDPTGF